MALLQEIFPDCIIFYRRGDINWPPRLCDLAPFDFFFCGATRKTVLIADKLATLEHLKTEHEVAQ